MDRNNMTGEPNQQNPSSVFGFDPYPPSYPINWNQSDPFASSTQFSALGPQQPQVCMESRPDQFTMPQNLPIPQQQMSVETPISQFHVNPLPQPHVSYSFGESRPTQDVVQFPFQVTNHGFGQRTLSMRCKRKTESPPLQPVKQHITEEKMTEHMAKLHINSETACSSKESDSARMQRLYMCEEMRKLQTDSILPHSLLARLERPCTALVLWRPPTRLVPVLVDNNDTESENNNEQSQPDNNVMENELEMLNVNDGAVNNMEMDNL